MWWKMTATFLILFTVYAAAQWDYRLHKLPHWQHRLGPAGLQRLVAVMGTAYLCADSLKYGLRYAGLLPAKDEGATGLPTFVLLELAIALILAYAPLRTWLMQRLRLNPQRILHGLLLYWMVELLATTLTSYASHVSTGIPIVRTSFFQLGYAVSQFKMLGLALLAAGLASKPSWAQVSQRLHLQQRPKLRNFAWALSAVLLLVITKIALLYLGAAYTGSSLKAAQSIAPPGFSWSWLLMVTLGAGVVEEAFYRGLLQPRLGIFVTSLLFTLIHLHYTWYALLGVFSASLTLGWIARRYGLWVAITSHALHNWFVIYLLKLPLSGRGVLLDSLLIGGGVALVMAAALAYLWRGARWYQRRMAKARADSSSQAKQAEDGSSGPQRHPWLLGATGAMLLLGAGFLLVGAMQEASSDTVTLLRAGIGVLTALLCLPWLRALLMRSLHLDPRTWWDTFILYALCVALISWTTDLVGQDSEDTWIHGQDAFDLGWFGEKFMLGFLVPCLCIGIGLRAWQRRSLRHVGERLGLNHPMPRQGWIVAPLVATAIAGASYGLWQACGQLSSLWGAELPKAQAAWQAHQLDLLPTLLVIATILLIVLMEDLFFRGALQPRLGLGWTSLLAALSGAGWIYLFYGLTPALLVVALYSLGSLLLGWLARRYGLWMSMLTHGCVHGLFCLGLTYG